MVVATFLKDNKKKIESKYHQVAKHLDSQYGLIHRRVTSRFHRDTNERELIRSKINNLITKSTLSIESKIKLKILTPIFLKTSTKKIHDFYPESIDWTRGRFSGQTIQILVREGKIIEKIFLTPKGNKISVKRSELGLQFR
tara:strand:- start:436 stop:858 length:423 start_codon:yes stop_codon:yes gene_type:complete